MTEKLRPAVRLAAAYTHLTDRLPRHIRASTFCDALHLFDERKLCGRFYRIRPEYLDVVESHPLCRATRALEAKGYRMRPSHERTSKTSHTVDLINEMGVVAHAYRSGHWSIDFGRGGRGKVTS